MDVVASRFKQLWTVGESGLPAAIPGGNWSPQDQFVASQDSLVLTMALSQDPINKSAPASR